LHLSVRVVLVLLLELVWTGEIRGRRRERRGGRVRLRCFHHFATGCANSAAAIALPPLLRVCEPEGGRTATTRRRARW
jgi:hypothetical protein